MVALIAVLSTYKGANREQRHIPRLGMLYAALIIILALTLYGCGGAVSTADVQPSATPTDPTTPTTPTTPGTPVPETGSATLSWAAPSTNVDGTPISALGGYKVYYGITPGVYTSLDVGPVSSYQVSGLTKGQMYYFTVTAYDANGNESDYSTVVSKIIG